MTRARSMLPPSLEELCAAYMNQRAWVQRVGSLDGAKRRREVFLKDEILAARTGSAGALMLPSQADRSIEKLPDALSWLRRSGSGDVLIWAATPDREMDRWLTAHGARDSFAPLWMIRKLDAPLPPTPSASIALVRPAEPGDLPELLRRSDIPYFSAWQARATVHLSTGAALDPPLRLLVALVGGEIVGRGVVNVSSTEIGSVVGLYDVAIAPQWQRQGIGRQLVHALMRAARESGASYATLNATPAGEGLYREFGFEVVGTGQTWLLPAMTLLHPPTDAQITFAKMISGGEDLHAMKGLASCELPNGDTPLAHAARFDQPDAARQLVQLDTIPDVAALWDLGLTEESRAMMGYPEALDTLRGSQRVAPLHVAIHWNDLEFLQALLDAGADPSVRDGTFDGDAWGWCHALDNDDALAMISNRHRSQDIQADCIDTDT